jgi:alcohol dehydrogenase
VLGHEVVGEIVAIGPAGAVAFDGRPLCPGDRVTWSIVLSCGVCYYCQRQLAAKCERLMKFGHEAIAPGRDLVGGFAQHCRLPEGTAIFHVPEQIPDLVASPANCATATVAAVFREAGEIAGQTVVIVGAGMLGLTACAMAATCGATHVIAVETDAARAALAPCFGAQTVLDGADSDSRLRESVLPLTGGRGADAVFEFSGIPDAFEATWQLLRFGGRMVMAGATFPARPVRIPAEQVVRRMLRISGVHNYAPQDLAEALSFLATQSHRFPFLSLVGRVFPLSHIQDALEYAEAHRPPRVALRPD